ncbi:MAG: sugar transferase [Patescibacteria group bacterium]|nr:sugar transferase [Patescibacteria group bacterium]MDD5715171.1 sugar transferase [Patescibacteria group bacterium]
MILIPVDYCMVILAGFFAYQMRFIPFFTELRPVVSEIVLREYLGFLFVVPIIFIVIFALSGLYAIKITRRLIDEATSLFVTCTASIAIVIIIIFFQRELFSSRFIVLIGWILCIVTVMIGRFIVRGIQRALLRRGVGQHNVLIIGKDKTTEDIIKQIYQHPTFGYRILARHDSFSDDVQKQVTSSLATNSIDEIIQADTSLPKEQGFAIRNFCNDHHITFKYTTDLFEVQPTHIEINTIAGIPIIEVKRTKLEGWGRISKRIFDMVFATIFLIVISPLLLIVGLLVAVDSKGGVFVKLERVGERGKTFTLYKFRSMVQNAHLLKKDLIQHNERSDGPLFKISNDPRITRIGRFIRKTSLDELPQFFNVLKGEMSIVGPRPHEPEEVSRYERWHRTLLTIKPGLTGLAQISGRSDLKFEDEAKLDIYYIENWSMKLDLQISLKTPLVVISGKSAS